MKKFSKPFQKNYNIKAIKVYHEEDTGHNLLHTGVNMVFDVGLAVLSRGVPLTVTQSVASALFIGQLIDSAKEKTAHGIEAGMDVTQGGFDALESSGGNINNGKGPNGAPDPHNTKDEEYYPYINN